VWIIGQRVIAEFEPELGLGTIIQLAGGRFVEVLFPGAEVTRRYNLKGAPLKRVVLNVGQKASHKNGTSFQVTEIIEQEGLLLYKSTEIEVWEYELHHALGDASPLHLLLTGQWSPPKAFDLRMDGWKLKGKYLGLEAKGLQGPRVALLPHQLFIAHEVSRREFPRVLLADEVGLGKTIEAGLIYSALRALGRANRVLILTPEALKHQWLAEMYRRFNEMFSVVDEERNDEEILSQGKSAFQMNQRIICSMDFLIEDPDRVEDAMTEPWDLLIIDEAHHLRWDEVEPSPQWEIAKLLAARARGVLLLTATPESRGLETEFGLLHLVDPARFPDFDSFKENYGEMHDVAQLAKRLHQGERGADLFKAMEKRFSADKAIQTALKAYRAGGEAKDLLRHMIDRHGTGRVLVRNRRARLQGFPERRLIGHKLKAPEGWTDYLKGPAPKELEPEEMEILAAGQVGGPLKGGPLEWFQARAKWLGELVKSLDGQKALLICARAKRTVELQTYLRDEAALRTGIFHEGLEIVERDRQAAWFAQAEGAQTLLCSEIGGEGRNFQFASHLILFDLPTSPDVLEQRIGRLDRIGQNRPIHIHVPYFEGTPEEVFFRWYSEGLNAFLEPWNGGPILEELQKPRLEAAIAALKGGKKAEEKLEKLIETSRKASDKVRAAQKESVDILIDLNSFDEEKGQALKEEILKQEASPELVNFLDKAFDFFGVELEELDHDGTLKASTHSLSFVEHFPGLTDRGEQSITFKRGTALVREEVNFLTLDHPIAQGGMSLVLEGDTGRAAVVRWRGAKFQGPAITEWLFILQAPAPLALEIERDLPLKPLTVFLTLDGQPLPAPAGLETADLIPAPAKMADQFGPLRDKFHVLHEKANQILSKQVEPLLKEALAHCESRFRKEIVRLKELSEVNPLINPAEITRLEKKLADSRAALSGAALRLDAVRVIMKD